MSLGEQLYTEYPADTFTAVSGQSSFTLSREPASVNALLVVIGGVIQTPGSVFTVTGKTLNTPALAVGTKVIVYHLAVMTTSVSPGAGTVGLDALAADLKQYIDQFKEGYYQLNRQVITSNVNIPAGYNAQSAGPLLVADGVSIDIANGSTWVVN